MSEDTRHGAIEPDAVQLHLHRGIGWGLYGTATAVVLALVLAGVTANLSSGDLLIAGVIGVVGLALTAFLAFLTNSIVTPSLIATADGISGRLSRWGRVDADWDEVTIDVDDNALPGTIRLDIGEESVSVSGRSWVGFGGFVLLVASTPKAAARLTQPARDELSRLLHIDGR
jgi:hypothetical protein